ncbi:unnamed protein product [Euphydryas editha]|uniref:Uncharacterized protein n=1 Tax=Euphydryas editha TaxID=104508 RepID=A0AAU9U8K7_EUPED|nr:unnamed protein product [Euphydryas editha]
MEKQRPPMFPPIFVVYIFGSHKKWTWMNPDGYTRNEINLIMTTRQIFNEVSVIHTVTNGSDHLLVRGTLNASVKLEQSRMMKSKFRPSIAYVQSPESHENCVSVDDIKNKLAAVDRPINTLIWKSLRHDIRVFYTKRIKDSFQER